VFLGIGYGTVRTRAVRAGAALIAFLVIVVYWSVQAAAAVLSNKGFIPPVVAQQLANLIMLVVAVRGYRSATW
jgi:lipopolysaccharide export LptBFGC system permease protein LptF